ncbi:hypothetical protein TNCV_1305341 [Trichonephila clavipes]|nr:hypothetical protein TNCV_1305341 [Trichonephila clavipes]
MTLCTKVHEQIEPSPWLVVTSSTRGVFCAKTPAEDGVTGRATAVDQGRCSPHTQEFQQAYGTVVLINAICKEAHLLGFHGGGAAHKPLITQSNRTTRFRWCKALKQETSDGWKRVLDP